MMSARQLASLVRETRKAQRRYFTSRTIEDLELSKRAERILDEAVAGILDGKSDLFSRLDERDPA